MIWLKWTFLVHMVWKIAQLQNFSQINQIMIWDCFNIDPSGLIKPTFFPFLRACSNFARGRLSVLCQIPVGPDKNLSSESRLCNQHLDPNGDPTRNPTWGGRGKAGEAFYGSSLFKLGLLAYRNSSFFQVNPRKSWGNPKFLARAKRYFEHLEFQ